MYFYGLLWRSGEGWFYEGISMVCYGGLERVGSMKIFLRSAMEVWRGLVL